MKTDTRDGLYTSSMLIGGGLVALLTSAIIDKFVGPGTAQTLAECGKYAGYFGMAGGGVGAGAYGLRGLVETLCGE